MSYVCQLMMRQQTDIIYIRSIQRDKGHKELVEAAGFEPASGHGDSAGATCLVRCYFSPLCWLRTAALGPVLIDLADSPGEHGLAASLQIDAPSRLEDTTWRNGCPISGSCR